MIQGISPQPWRETSQFLQAGSKDTAWPTLTETPAFLPKMTSPPSALKPSHLCLTVVVTSSLSLASWGSEAGEIPSVLKLVHSLRQFPWAGLAPALNLLLVFPPVSPCFERAAAFELQTATIYTQNPLSSMYALTALPDQAKEHGVLVELIHLFSSVTHSQVIQESFAVLEYYHQTPS